MGGSNIVESDNISTGFNHMNRDNDVYVEGPIATEAMLNYIMLWKKYEVEKNIMNQDRNPNVKDITIYEKLAHEQKEAEKLAGSRGSDQYPVILNEPLARNKGVCRFVTQNPD